nr:hypothetical protein [Tanacetum cinerariifolium]
MGYLVYACYNISPTRYYKDDSCWSVDLKSKATEDIISIRSFLEVLVLNHYVLVRKIFTNSTNEVPTAYGVSTASTQSSTASTNVSTANLSDDIVYAFLSNQSNGSQLVHEDLEQIHEDDLEEIDLKWHLALLSIRAKRFFQKTKRKITINGSDTASFDKSKVECYNCHKMGHFSREHRQPRNQDSRQPRNQDSRSWNQDSSRRTVNMEETPPNAMVAIDGVGFDWSYMAEDEVPTNMAFMAFSDFEGLGYESYHVVPPPPTGLFSPPKIDLSYSGLEEFQQPEFQSYRPKSCEIEFKNASKEIPNELKEYLDDLLVKNRVSDNKDCSVESLVVVEKNIVVPTVTKVKFVRPKQQEKPVRKLIKYAEMYRSQGPRGNQRNWNNMKSQQLGTQSTVTKPYKQRTSFTNKSFRQTVNTARPRPVNTVRPRLVNTIRPRPANTAKPNSAVVNVVKGHPQQVQEDQGYVDSGCSRHMTENMSYLLDFKEFNRGYVTFGGGANGGKKINTAREKKEFFWVITPLFETTLVQASEEVGEGLEVPTDAHNIPIVTQPSSSQPQKKQKSMRIQRKETELVRITTAGEVVTTAKDVEVVAAATTLQISKDDVTLAQTLIEIKAAKPKARGVIVKEPCEFRTTSSLQPSQLPQAKDKDKGIMIEPKKPLKKDQIAFDEEVARKLDAQIKAEMEEEERIAMEKNEANIVVIEQWDKVQAKIDADMELAQKLQTEEQEQLTDAEKARLFMKFLEKRRKFLQEREKF